MRIRKTPTVAKRKMNCKHPKWTLDKNSLGTCVECGATRQFPVECKLELRPSEISAIEGLDTSGDFDGWLHTQLPDLEGET